MYAAVEFKRPTHVMVSLDPEDSDSLPLMKQAILRLRQKGYRVGTITVQGLAEPQLIVDQTRYVGSERIQRIVELLEQQR